MNPSLSFANAYLIVLLFSVLNITELGARVSDSKDFVVTSLLLDWPIATLFLEF